MQFITGKDLRWHRRNAVLTQAMLAKQVGTTGSYIAALERRDELPPTMRVRLARILQFYYDHPLLESNLAAVVRASEPAPPAHLALPEPVPSGRNYERLTPEQRAQNQERQRQESERLREVRIRNKMRAIARPQIVALQAHLATLAVAEDPWPAYRVALGEAAITAENNFVMHFIKAAQARVIPADDPLVTLPPEPIEPIEPIEPFA